MSKFKFGDKVWHDEFGLGFIIQLHGFEIDLTYSVMFEDMVISGKNIKLTKVSDWIPCSERMPDIDVEVLVYFDGYIYIDSLYYDKNLKEYWWQGNCRLPTHWMPLPEMTEVKE